MQVRDFTRSHFIVSPTMDLQKEDNSPLEVFYLPFLAPGHMIPMVEMARLFASRGVKVTIITTPLNSLLVKKPIEEDSKSGVMISLHELPFPYKESGLPDGCENFFHATTFDLAVKLYHAIELLKQPIEQLFRDVKPDCIVSDMFYPWTADIAAELGIQRLVYHATCLFSLSLKICIREEAPHELVESDSEVFVVPGLPGPTITMCRSQLPDYARGKSGYGDVVQQMRESELRSFGVVVNNFYEMEPVYTKHYEALGSRVWHVGPVSLIHKDTGDQAERGHKVAINQHECLNWLNSKNPNSVLYVCFGSACRFPTTQMLEIAAALESSCQHFIWVVLGKNQNEEDDGEWLPEGFEERMKDSNKGLIIWGWAPQVLILDHPSIGGFMSHCGWNSVLEAVSSGVPMVTWPLYAEHFYNEKLVTQVLKNGVPIGVEDWNLWTEAGKVVKGREKIEKAVNHLMGGGKYGEEMRANAKELGVMAKRAVKEGGSSYNSLSCLMDELQTLKQQRKKTKVC
ncbi:hypothetical protein GIB67_026697 [Kingdonia uniflora]|uniref:Glycosyltransferase n=1 Tax=Kingdonia uniflora TaxID=39325 RepID=A0A7J7M276_9MAGN|nr:hypothetical protein GIB67_026697 [Kingdonia uniflora]